MFDRRGCRGGCDHVCSNIYYIYRDCDDDVVKVDPKRYFDDDIPSLNILVYLLNMSCSTTFFIIRVLIISIMIITFYFLSSSLPFCLIFV